MDEYIIYVEVVCKYHQTSVTVHVFHDCVLGPVSAHFSTPKGGLH